MKVPDVDIEQKDIDRALEQSEGLMLGTDLRPNWSVGPCVLTRDSELLETSNYESLLAHLREDHPELEGDWETQTFSHWGYGWVKHLTFRVLNEDGTPSDIFRVLTAWNNALSAYPVADDEDYSRR